MPSIDFFLIFKKDRVRQRQTLDTVTHYEKSLLQEKIRIKVEKEEHLRVSTEVKGRAAKNGSRAQRRTCKLEGVQVVVRTRNSGVSLN